MVEQNNIKSLESTILNSIILKLFHNVILKVIKMLKLISKTLL